MASNQFSNTSWVSMEILRLLLNKLTITEYFNHGYNKEFNKEFAIGDTATIKFPTRPVVLDVMGYSPVALSRATTKLTMDQWLQVPFEWDDYEAAVKLERSEEELRENYWDPAGAALAQEWDSRSAKFAYQNSSNVIGVLGADPTTVATYYQARQRLLEKACPPGKRCMNISTSMMATLGTNITSVFHPADEVTKMWKEGAIGTLAGFMFYESNSLYSHTAGTWQGAVTVNGAGQSGTAITINATAGDTFKQGDKIAFALTNAVNPQTRRIAGKAALMNFTVTADLTAAGGGSDVLNILPAIYGPGSQYQNVDALPANSAALTLWPGTTSPNGKVGTVGLGLSKYAFAIAAGKIFVPTSTEKAGQATDPDTGFSVRKVKAWDAVRSVQIQRLDSLGGFGNLYQDNGAVCVVGA